MRTNDMIKVHMYMDGNRERSPYTCKGDVFTPFETFAQTVIFENVETGELYHWNNISNSVVKVVENTMRTYDQDLKELNITAEEFDNVISNIYDKSDKEMIAISKAIKSGAGVLPVVQRALERVLRMRQTERQEAYNFHYNL